MADHRTNRTARHRKCARTRATALARRVRDGAVMPLPRPAHPLDHHPSFRAVIDAAPAIAALGGELIGTLAIACSDLAHGFASPPDSKRRLAAHRRAWFGVRQLDRAVTDAARRRRAPADVISRAQRAIDRADVLIGALLPV